MCEIFPEVKNFLGCINLRVGMLIISIIAIVTGALMLAVLQKNYDISVSEMVKKTLSLAGSFVVHAIFAPSKFLDNVLNWIPHGLTLMCFGFMLFGFILMFATLTDQEGFAQVFVWGTFLTIILGFLMLLAICYQCMVFPACFVSSLDWLTAAVVLVALATYLFGWIYFIVVANSYVVQA